MGSYEWHIPDTFVPGEIVIGVQLKNPKKTVGVVPVTVAGIVLMAREGLTLARAREISARAAAEERA